MSAAAARWRESPQAATLSASARSARATVRASDPLRWSLVALTVLTAVALGTTREVTVFAFAVPLAAPLGIWLERRGTPPGRIFEMVFRVLSIGFLAYFLACIVSGRILAGAAGLTLPVQVYLMLQPRSLGSLRRLALLAFFQIVALSAATTMVLFLPLLLAFIVLAPVALTLLALEEGARGAAATNGARGAALANDALPVQRGEDRVAPRGLLLATLAASLGMLLLGAVAFLVLPRYEAGLLESLAGVTQRMSGFSETVEFGDLAGIKERREVLMTVRVTGPVPSLLLWRGIALDNFSGRTWSVSDAARRVVRGKGRIALRTMPAAGEPTRQDFDVQSSRTRAIFHLEPAVEVTPDGVMAVEIDGLGNLHLIGGTAGHRSYVVISHSRARDTGSLAPDLRAACLQLPDLDPHVVRLAGRIVEGAETDLDRAQRIASWLQTERRYTLAVNDRDAPDPVARFLIDGAPGHCEYFASSMAVLLRVEGIPSRVVNGFRGGDRSSFLDAQVVRWSDAHSWVEAWIEGQGWLPFDPTPPGRPSSRLGVLQEAWERVQEYWDDHVIGFNYTYQVGFLRVARERLAALRERLRGSEGRVPLVLGSLVLLGVAGALLSWAAARRHRGRAPRPSLAWYRRVLRLMASRGWRMRDGQSPGELGAEVVRESPLVGAPFVALTQLYQAERFAGRKADRSRRMTLVAALEASLSGAAKAQRAREPSVRELDAP